ncbi:MAG TPA: hypothetical protein ENN40_00570 [Candidatus Aminicenantes bacterium]|nr:hypothetical protein [Candidatus Aminicenantes bacterium]
MNYTEALQYLDSVRDQGAKLELKNVRDLIRNLPFDLSSTDFIQVAGTNGKGSTSHFAAAILNASGLRTGLFTSPHLQTIRERIAVDGDPIKPQEFARSLSAVRDISLDLVQRGKVSNMPTFFEHLFLTAIHHFHSSQVEVAVMEVGLGGRLDATTSLDPLVTAITNISRDHTKTLGPRIRDIAREKAGIIKSGTPLVCGCPKSTVGHRLIKQICLKKNAPFHTVTRNPSNLTAEISAQGYNCFYQSETAAYRYQIRMNGIHQARNAATAIRIAEIYLEPRAPLCEATVATAISNTTVPGRIESIPGTPTILLDGGHNLEGTRALSQFLAERNLKDLTVIFGVLRDKPYRLMVRMIAPFVGNVIITEPRSHRALPAELAARWFPEHTQPAIERDYARALQMARAVGRTILITGSLYMAGDMRTQILGGDP